ncbi:FOXL1-like protein [Mya arenaria]|uniref:FOXL1-like protein n=2 Tax=Mya arenaria TaxID=6604 RepID=A0ABY7FLZ0_MYAAR|nr:FOXL1-like protein [Mya arenaria]
MDVRKLDQPNQAFSTVPIENNFQPEENVTTVDHDLSPLCSPIDESRGRGTPSPPLHDSGIESDNSPTASQLSKTLKTLNKKAAAVQSRKVTHSKSSSSDFSPDAEEKEKPRQSYISLIVQAILSSPDSRMTLGDIYRHISDNHSYYDNEERSWRNSIRYNLSINECFMKNGKEESGKGNYWTIHPACLDDFRKGDYRRRQARRRAKRNVKTVNSASATSSVHMGSYVPMTSCVTGYQGQQGLSDLPGHRYGAHQFASAQTTLPHTVPQNNIPYYSMMPPYGSVPVYASPYHAFPPMPYAFTGSSAQPEMDSRGIVPARTWYTPTTNTGSAYEPEGVSDSNTVVIET